MLRNRRKIVDGKNRGIRTEQLLPEPLINHLMPF